MLLGLELLEPLAATPGAPRRAQLVGSGRVVAVRHAPWHEEERSAALDREATVLGDHAGPGLVGLVDVGEDEHGRWVVLEHLPGGSLRQHVARAGPLAPAAALDLAAGVAATLARLHEHGVAHGAVDADHVLLDAELRPVLCDLRSSGPASDPVLRARDTSGVGEVLAHALGAASDTRAERSARPRLEDRSAPHATPGSDAWTGHDAATVPGSDAATVSATRQDPAGGAVERARALAARLRSGAVADPAGVVAEIAEAARPDTDATGPPSPRPATRAVPRDPTVPAAGRPPLGVADDPRARLLAGAIVLTTLAVPIVVLLG